MEKESTDQEAKEFKPTKEQIARVKKESEFLNKWANKILNEEYERRGLL